MNLLITYGILVLPWHLSYWLFNYDVVFLRKLAIRGHLMFSKCVDDVVELLHWFAFPPRLGTRVDESWELVGAYRSSNRGFNVEQFYRMSIFDLNVPIDDPFRPDHLSTLHMGEVRHRNLLWYTIVIWRMSLINHGQWKLHEFDFNYDIRKIHALTNLFAKAPRCFESNGVVFVCLINHICIYDTRLDLATDYHVPEFGGPGAKGMVTCMGRTWETKSVLGGWNVRVIDRRCSKRYQDRRRLIMINRVFQMTLISGARLDSQEEIVFGGSEDGRVFRTSVGCGQTDDTYGPTVIYDTIRYRWLFWHKFQYMLSTDSLFNRYYRHHSKLNGIVQYPVFLNDRECISFTSNGYIYRTQFEPPSLRFTAATSLFRSDPSLRWRINADQFEKSTGIGGMERHLDGGK